MPAVANAFSAEQVARTLFADETVTYTWGPQSLPVGDTTVFDEQDWNGSSPDRVAILTGYSATQSPGVRVLWTADDTNSNEGQGYTDAAPGGLYPVHLHAAAVTHLALVIRNNSGAAIANFQLNYTVRVRRLLVTEKLALPSSALSAEDEAALAAVPVQPNQPTALALAQQAVARGARPGPLDAYYDAFVRSQEVTSDIQATPWHFAIGATNTYVDLPIGVPPGMLLELGRIVPAAAYADAPILTVTRDSQQIQNSGFVAVNLAAAAGPANQPFGPERPFRVYAKTNMLLRLYGTAGSTYAVWPETRLYRRTPLLDATLDIGAKAGPDWGRVRAGLM
jgi:hypothetical protein